MKAERRHDLKTNALAAILADFPGFLRDYGSRILLGVLIVALAALLIYNYTTGRSAQDVQNREALSTGAYYLGQANEELSNLNRTFLQIRQQEMFGGRGPTSEQIASFIESRVAAVQNLVKDAQKSITDASGSNDPSVKSDAEVLRGNANMLLANVPPAPGSDTRPSLNGDRTHDELLRSAEDSYNQVLRPPLSTNAQAVRNARFGLAAIAEDRHEWDKARQFYQQIIDDSATPAPFKDNARSRQEQLAELQKPILIGSPPSHVFGPELPSFLTTTPSTIPQSTTEPAIRQPVTTQPATTSPATTFP